MLYRHTVAVVACAVSLLTSSAFAASVNVAGKEWRQVSETLGYSWTQIAGVCPAGGGVCTGSLVGADFTGWTWATIRRGWQPALSGLQPVLPRRDQRPHPSREPVGASVPHRFLCYRYNPRLRLRLRLDRHPSGWYRILRCERNELVQRRSF